MSCSAYDNMRIALMLAGFQKIEDEIKRVRGIERGHYCIEEDNLELLSKWDFISEYLPDLFAMIDHEKDISGNIGYFYLFREIMEDIYNDSTGEVTDIYQMHLGLLSEAVEQYGIEPFEEIITEFEKSLSGFGIDALPLTEYCNCMYVDVEGVDEGFTEKLAKYATYLRFTYIIQFDMVYVTSNDVMNYAGVLPAFMKKYDTFCEKLTEICLSLKGERAS